MCFVRADVNKLSNRVRVMWGETRVLVLCPCLGCWRLSRAAISLRGGEIPKTLLCRKKEDAKCPRYEILWLFVISIVGNFVICQYRCLFVISIVGFFFFFTSW